MQSDLEPKPADSLTPCCQHFQEAEFDAIDYVHSRITLLPLTQFKSDLSSVFKEFKGELVELINRDYADFIGLSLHWVGLDHIVSEGWSPLHHVQKRVEDARRAHQQVMDILQAKLEQRRIVCEKKSFLQNLVHIHTSLEKLEELLINQSETELDGKALERVAIEYNQLQYLVSQAQDVPFIQHHQWRINRIKETLAQQLTGALERAYLQCIQPNNDSMQEIWQYLRIHLLMDKVDQAEHVFRLHVIDPFVQKAFEMPVNPPLSSSTSGAFLKKVYDTLLEFFIGPCRHVLDISARVLRGTQYDLVVDTLWPALVKELLTLGPIYNPGIPSVFHQNYLLTRQFLNRFELECCKTRKSVSLLRAQPSYAEFLKKWQLATYFQIKTKELNQLWESSGDGTEKSNQPHSGFLLLKSNVLLDILEQCWSDTVFIYGLCHKFWQFSLEMISKYTQTMTAMIQKSTPRPSLTEATTPSTPSMTEDMDRSLFLYLHHDLHSLLSGPLSSSSHTSSLLFTRIFMKFPSGLIESSKAVYIELFESVTHGLEEIRSLLNDKILVGLKQECEKKLADIKAVPREYRGTRRPAPTSPSAYVSTLFTPLVDFQKQFTALASLDSQQIKSVYTDPIIDYVANRFQQTVIELLLNEKRLGESLMRMRRVKAGKVTEEGDSDEDKIRKQMMLDAQQFGQEILGLGSDPGQQPAYVELMKKLETNN